MLTTETARALLMRDRLDWNRPHVNWLTRSFYALRFPRKHDSHPPYRGARKGR